MNFASPLAMCPVETMTAKGSASNRHDLITTNASSLLNAAEIPSTNHNSNGYIPIIHTPSIQPPTEERLKYSVKCSGIQRNMDWAVFHSLHNSPVTNPETIITNTVTGHDATDSLASNGEKGRRTTNCILSGLHDLM